MAPDWKSWLDAAELIGREAERKAEPTVDAALSLLEGCAEVIEAATQTEEAAGFVKESLPGSRVICPDCSKPAYACRCWKTE